jgi:hypothetical protein
VVELSLGEGTVAPPDFLQGAELSPKPLQGTLFRQFRKLILNLSDADDDLAYKVEDQRIVFEEQSENDDVHPGACDESGNDGRSIMNDVDEEMEKTRKIEGSEAKIRMSF